MIEKAKMALTFFFFFFLKKEKEKKEIRKKRRKNCKIGHCGWPNL
jgi:hypothetical protein